MSSLVASLSHHFKVQIEISKSFDVGDGKIMLRSVLQSAAALNGLILTDFEAINANGEVIPDIYVPVSSLNAQSIRLVQKGTWSRTILESPFLS